MGRWRGKAPFIYGVISYKEVYTSKGKYTSKELNFHADFKYIGFIKFGLWDQKLRAWENLSYFRK